MSRRKSLALREPNGRVQRDPPLPPPSEVRRLRDAALSGMRDPTWGTELGRLYLAGKVTAMGFSAGKRWAEQASKYSQALCSPSADPRAIDLNRSGGEPVDPDSPEGLKEARRHERAVSSFMDAYAALRSTRGDAERAVRSVCERDEMLAGYDGHLALVRGLDALASYWGLTENRKSLSDRQS